MAQLMEHAICPNPDCRAPLPDGVIWCPVCGEDLLAAPAEESAPGEAPVSAPPEIATERQATVLLVLPNHLTVPLPDGEPVELGRETRRSEIDSALEDFIDVSRHHAVIELRDGEIHLSRDRAAPDNPIEIEQRTVTDTAVVRIGERFRLGANCWFRVVEG